MKFIQETCCISTYALILVVQSMFPHENSVVSRYFTTCSLKRFISCNSDNSVQTVIITGNTYFPWQHQVIKGFHTEFSIISIVLP